MNTNITYAVIDGTTSHSTKPASGQVAGYPAQAGIQRSKNNPRSGQELDLVPLRGDYPINWIPACAGMTEF